MTVCSVRERLRAERFFGKRLAKSLENSGLRPPPQIKFSFIYLAGQPVTFEWLVNQVFEVAMKKNAERLVVAESAGNEWVLHKFSYPTKFSGRGGGGVLTAPRAFCERNKREILVCTIVQTPKILVCTKLRCAHCTDPCCTNHVLRKNYTRFKQAPQAKISCF